MTIRLLTKFSVDLARGPSVCPPVSNDLEIIKTNILSKLHEVCLKNVTSRVLTIFSFKLTW